MRSLMTWKPMTAAPLFADLDRLFDTAWSNGGTMQIPAADVVERNDHYLVRLDLPGLKKEDITVTVEREHLVIHGRRENEVSEETDNVLRHERRFGEFTRSFRLGERTSADGIEATYRDGVLEVKVPKSERAKPRQISVQ